MGQQRTIVQKGVLRLTLDERKAERLVLTSTVAKHPRNEFLNLKYRRPQGFYGYAQLMQEQFVWKTVPIDYETQILLDFRNFELAMMTWHECAIYGVLVSIANLGQALGYTASIDRIPRENFLCPVTEVLFHLYGDTTLNIELNSFGTPQVCPAVEPSFKEPNEQQPSAPNREREPGTDPDNPTFDKPSAPYDGATNDDGDTYFPYPTGDTGHWVIDYSGFNFNCEPYSGTLDLSETSRTANIAWTYANEGGTYPCGVERRATVTSNGVVINTQGVGVNLTYSNPRYVEG